MKSSEFVCYFCAIIFMRFVVFFLLAMSPWLTFAQQWVFPDQSSWTHLEEGKLLTFDLKLSENIHDLRYSLDGSNGYGMKLDSLGHFSWTPSFDLVDRIEKQKEVSVIFQATWGQGKKLRQPVNFIVKHVNRPPVVEELPAFYVKQNTANK